MYGFSEALKCLPPFPCLEGVDALETSQSALLATPSKVWLLGFSLEAGWLASNCGKVLLSVRWKQLSVDFPLISMTKTYLSPA